MLKDFNSNWSKIMFNSLIKLFTGKSFKYPIRQPTRGERVLASLFPNRGTGWPGGWSQDRVEQVMHFKHWTYVAIDAICSKVAQHIPNAAYLEDMEGPKTFKTAKALGSIVGPDENLSPLGINHPLKQLLANPNQHDTAFNYWYETQMFLELCGVSYTWIVPNRFGIPVELWCIPSHWVWPRTGQGFDVDPHHPNASRLIDYYEIRPWGGIGSSGILHFPAEEVIMEHWPSPINKLDGYSVLAAIAQWIDTEESISRSRWSQFINTARPELHVQLGPAFEDPDEETMDRIYQKFFSRYMGERNYGKPLITPPGSTVTPLSFNPTEMAYFQSEEQIRDMILSAFRVPKQVVGVTSDSSFGAILAAMGSFCTFCINPRLSMRGQALTKHLANKYTSAPRPIRVWWDDVTPADPQQVNSDIGTDLTANAITPNEVRRLRGRAPYQYGGDDPLISGPGGVVPLPLNTGDDLTDLGALVPTLGQQEEPMPGQPDFNPADDFDFGDPIDPMYQEPIEIDPSIEEPNSGGTMNKMPVAKGRGQPCQHGENAIKTGCIPMGKPEKKPPHAPNVSLRPDPVGKPEGEPTEQEIQSDEIVIEEDPVRLDVSPQVYESVELLSDLKRPDLKTEEELIKGMVREFFGMVDKDIVSKCAVGTIIYGRCFCDYLLNNEYRDTKVQVKQSFQIGEIGLKMYQASYGQSDWTNEDSVAYLELLDKNDTVELQLIETWFLKYATAFPLFSNLNGIREKMPDDFKDEFLEEMFDSFRKNLTWPQIDTEEEGPKELYQLVVRILKQDLKQFLV